MNNKETSKRLFDANIRAETIIHLASSCLGDHFPDRLEDVLDDCGEEVYDLLGIEIDDPDDAEEFYEQLHHKDKFGFLVALATPVPENVTQASFSFSWGLCRVKWFYEESLDEIYESGLLWQESIINEARKKTAMDP